MCVTQLAQDHIAHKGPNWNSNSHTSSFTTHIFNYYAIVFLGEQNHTKKLNSRPRSQVAPVCGAGWSEGTK